MRRTPIMAASTTITAIASVGKPELGVLLLFVVAAIVLGAVLLDVDPDKIVWLEVVVIWVPSVVKVFFATFEMVLVWLICVVPSVTWLS